MTLKIINLFFNHKIMKQLEMKFKWTKVLTKCVNVKWEIFDFITSNINNHSFVWVWMYWDDDILWRTIYSQASHTEDTTLYDLVYEWAWEYITILDWLDEHPDMTWTNLWIEEQLFNWLTYLMEKDFIPNEF